MDFQKLWYIYQLTILTGTQYYLWNMSKFIQFAWCLLPNCSYNPVSLLLLETTKTVCVFCPEFDPSWALCSKTYFIIMSLPEKNTSFFIVLPLWLFPSLLTSTVLVPLFVFPPLQQLLPLGPSLFLKLDYGLRQNFCWAACCKCCQRSTTQKLTFC